MSEVSASSMWQRQISNDLQDTAQDPALVHRRNVIGVVIQDTYPETVPLLWVKPAINVGNWTISPKCVKRLNNQRQVNYTRKQMSHPCPRSRSARQMTTIMCFVFTTQRLERTDWFRCHSMTFLLKFCWTRDPHPTLLVRIRLLDWTKITLC